MKKRGLLSEFKEFMRRGNILDLAIGLTVGTAFTSIVRSLTNDILMPFIGSLMGGIDFRGLRIPLWNSNPVVDANGVVQYDEYGQVLYDSAIYYGRFIQSVIDFLIIAFVIFIVVKVINGIHRRAKERFMREREKEEIVEPTDSKEVLLLQEIRDLLSNQQANNNVKD